MKLNAKEIQVQKILLMPIEVISHKSTVYRYQDKIYSGQTYYSGLDPDMSDFAVAFMKSYTKILLLKVIF